MRTGANDKELVEALHSGNADAFDILFKRHAGKLYSFAYKYLRNKEDAEGLVQGVFLKVWDKRHKLNKEFSFQSFLFTIAYHDVCNIFRRRVTEREFKDHLARELLGNKDKRDHAADHKSMLECVEKLIEQLPEKQKTAFLKSRLEGLSSKEIAAELHLSSGTVDNYISAALKFIRSRLEKDALG